jgi:hypothetical protein
MLTMIVSSIRETDDYILLFFLYIYNAIGCAYILPLCLFVVFVDVHMIIFKARIKEKNILRNRSRVSRHDFKSIGVGVYVYIYVQWSATTEQSNKVFVNIVN